MALPLANSFDGGTDDVAVSAANSGGASGNAFDVVSIGAGSVGKYENSQSVRGGMAFEFSTGVTPESTFVSWSTSIGTYATVYGRFYLRLSAAPAAGISVLSTISGGTARARVQVTTARKLRILDAAGATIWTSTAAMSTATWYRVEFYLLNDAAVGVAQVKLFAGHGISADEDSGQFTGLNFGGTADRIRYGCVVNAASFPQTWMDDLQANATGFPGPSFNSATVATSFSFSGPATAVVKHPATVSTTFAFSASAAAVVRVPATVATSFTLGASAAATVKHPATVATSFTFTGLAVAALTVPVSIATTFSFSGPATATVVSGTRTVDWSGYTWKVRGSQLAALPGPNAWSDTAANVTVLGGVLQLAVVKSGSDYVCSEIELEQTLGYGKYSFVVNTDLSGLDPWAVLGIYTYDSSAASPYREIDIEAAKWGSADTDDLQFTVQPGAGAQVTRFPASSSAPYTLEFTWQTGQVYYEARDSGDTVVRSWAVNDSVPTTGAEHLFVNAWLYAGHAPDAGATIPFELSSFTFTAGTTKTLQKASTLSESFESTPVDWLAYNTASISGGNAVLPCGSLYSRWESGQVYDLTSSTTQVDVVGLPAVGNASTEAQFYAWHDASNYVLIEKIGTSLLCRVRDSGVDTDNYVTYSATGHRYWRIDEASGNVLFKTSADRRSWVTACTVPHTMTTALGVIQVRLSSGYYATESNPGNFLVAQVGAVPVWASSTTTVTAGRTSVAAVAAGRSAVPVVSAGRSSAPTVTGG